MLHHTKPFFIISGADLCKALENEPSQQACVVAIDYFDRVIQHASPALCYQRWQYNTSASVFGATKLRRATGSRPRWYYDSGDYLTTQLKLALKIAILKFGATQQPDV